MATGYPRKQQRDRDWWALNPSYQKQRRAGLRMQRVPLPSLDSTGLTLFFAYRLVAILHHREQSRLRSEKRRNENPEKVKALQDAWRKANPHKIKKQRQRFCAWRRLGAYKVT